MTMQEGIGSLSLDVISLLSIDPSLKLVDLGSQLFHLFVFRKQLRPELLLLSLRLDRFLKEDLSNIVIDSARFFKSFLESRDQIGTL